MAQSKYVIIQLSESGEIAKQTELEKTVEELFGSDVDFFIPTRNEKMGSYTSIGILFSGYIFVKDAPYIRDKLEELRDFRFFSSVLRVGSRIETIDSNVISRMKRQLRSTMRRNLSSGTMVIVLEGIFKDLVGEVISSEDKGKQVVVRIKRLSRDIIAPLPATSVKECS